MTELESVGFLYRLALPYLDQLGAYGKLAMPWALGLGTGYLILTRIYWTKVYGMEATKKVPLAWPITIPLDLALAVLALPLGLRISPSRLKLAETKLVETKKTIEDQDKYIFKTLEGLTARYLELMERDEGYRRKMRRAEKDIKEIKERDTVRLGM